MAIFRRRSAFGWGAPRGTKAFPPNFVFGFMTPERTLASSAWLPGPRERRSLGLNRVPYWHVINYAPAALASLDSMNVPKDNFVALAFLGTSTRGPNSYQSQFFQVTGTDGAQGRRMSRVPVIEANAFGSAQQPFVLKRPMPLPDLFGLLNRSANRATAANTIQIAIYGVQEYEPVS